MMLGNRNENETWREFNLEFVKALTKPKKPSSSPPLKSCHPKHYKKLDLFYSYELALGDPAPTFVPWLKTPKFIEIISKYYKYLMLRLIDHQI
jgi:hypothetical protein